MILVDLDATEIKMLLEKFPDTVSVELVDDKDVVEEVGDSINPVMAIFGVFNVRRTRLILTEVEPETGIFAALSPITHNLYVFKDMYGRR